MRQAGRRSGRRSAPPSPAAASASPLSPASPAPALVAGPVRHPSHPVRPDQVAPRHASLADADPTTTVDPAGLPDAVVCGRTLSACAGFCGDSPTRFIFIAPSALRSPCLLRSFVPGCELHLGSDGYFRVVAYGCRGSLHGRGRVGLVAPLTSQWPTRHTYFGGG